MYYANVMPCNSFTMRRELWYNQKIAIDTGESMT